MAWTVPKTWVAAEFVDAAEMNTHVRDNLNYLNDQRVEYAQITSNSAAFTAETTLITAPTYTPISASRLILITAHIRSWSVTNTDTFAEFAIKDSTTQYGEISDTQVSASVGIGGRSMNAYIANLSAGGHTFRLVGRRQTGTGTITVQASTTQPAQLIIQDIGAA